MRIGNPPTDNKVQPNVQFRHEWSWRDCRLKSATNADSGVHPIEHGARSLSKADVRAATRTVYANKRRRELEQVVEELAKRLGQNGH